MAPETAEAITATLIDLETTEPQHRLDRLKAIALEEGGIWAVPEARAIPQPVLYEVSLFGIAALALDPQDLPRNWCRVALALANAEGKAA